MKNFIKNLIVAVAGIVVLGAIYFYWHNLRGLLPVIKNPSGNIADIVEGQDQNSTNFPLKLPDGFSIEIFAKNLPGVRTMAWDSFGNIWVARTSKGVVTELEVKNGKVSSQNDVFKNLKNPHGLAIEESTLYLAEETKISKVALYSEDSLHKLVDLPSSGGGHFTRTLGFGPDGRLYVSIGSSCNVCRESDERRAAIYSMKKDGTDFKQYAKGLRNTVFFTWSYVDGSMWGTDNGRDLLGDNIPPDEINLLKEGGNYGWPNCYGNNVHDDNFDKNTYIRNPCMEPFETPAKVELQAHSAPLGLSFVPEEGWPEEYWYNLIVAFHGSWNRSIPTGYKLVRIKLDSKGHYLGTEDFLTGFLQGSSALGRPVGVYAQPGGVVYVTDDKAGVIYRIFRTK
ncbi:MAG: PQQ-dependent sugar dehydrogenase [Candidatus Doudnabacteria bacterium]|nr:PQQ-dependent sugar dehydrogenase [Candidatus Doudnabacteria bacterium]